MQQLEDEIVHWVSVGCIGQTYFNLCLCFLLSANPLRNCCAEFPCSQDLLRNAGYWSLNLTIHAQVNELYDSVVTRYTAPPLMLNSHISHSSPSLSFCNYCPIFSVPSARDYTHSIPGSNLYCCLPGFMEAFSAGKEETWSLLCWMKMNSMTEQRAMGSRELGAAPAQCSCRCSGTGKHFSDCRQKPSHHFVSLSWWCVRYV